MCKNCVSEQRRLYRLNNADKVSLQKAAYYENNKDLIYERAAVYYANNKARILESKRKYYISNKIDILEKHAKQYIKTRALVIQQHRQYCRNNPDKRRKHYAKRRAAKLQAMPVYGLKWLEELLVEEQYLISNVRSILTGVTHHVDHVVPLISDKVCGLHVSSNLRVILASDNLTKKNKLIESLL